MIWRHRSTHSSQMKTPGPPTNFATAQAEQGARIEDFVGRGVRTPQLTIADCGKNGDQIVRLFQMPASLYVIQYVGPIPDNIIKDVAVKLRKRRAEGEQAAFCVIDGSDTARLLHAFKPQ